MILASWSKWTALVCLEALLLQWRRLGDQSIQEMPACLDSYLPRSAAQEITQDQLRLLS